MAPALRGSLALPDGHDLVDRVIELANQHRARSEWDRAETLLMWTCCRFSPRQQGASSAFARVLRATGELYRHSLSHHTDPARLDFGSRGIDSSSDALGLDTLEAQEHPDVHEILDCYRSIRRRVTTMGPLIGRPGSIAPHDLLLDALRGRDRNEALFALCLVRKGPRVSEDLQPALALAVKNDWSEVVAALLELDADPNGRDEDNMTAIHYCADLGREGYVKRLADHGAELDWGEEKRDYMTPLHRAARNGHAGVVRLLLERGAEVDTSSMGSTAGPRPLFGAIRGGHEAVVRLLADNGADLQAADRHGRTPLSVAAESGDARIAVYLLSRGGGIHVEDKMETHAARLGHRYRARSHAGMAPRERMTELPV